MTEQIEITAEAFAKEVHRVSGVIGAAIKEERTIFCIYGALTVAHQGASVLQHAERVDLAATLVQMAQAIVAKPPAEGEAARQDVTLQQGLAQALAASRDRHALLVGSFHIAYQGKDGAPHTVEDLSAAIAAGDVAQASGDPVAQVAAFEALRGLQ